MKRKNILKYIGAFSMLLAVSACEDQLNINDNPNQGITADVQLVLPQAIVSTASLGNNFNSYGGHFGGMIANAGGFSGFGNLLNYNLTPQDYNGIWVATYQDPLKDLKYVVDNSEGNDQLDYVNAAAKIMSVVNYQRLVDAFGDVPFSQALQAENGIVAPAYDDQKVIYRNLYDSLNKAMDIIKAATTAQRLDEGSDPLFSEYAEAEPSEHMEAWLRFANTLKLRIVIRVSEVAGFEDLVSQATAEFAADSEIGFLTEDADVDPGYETNRPNPTWATWGRTTSGDLANSSRIPTEYAFGFYNGDKLSDFGRGNVSFVNYPATPTNQLGNEVGNPTIVSGQVTWAGNDSDWVTGVGILKGPGMAAPLMLAAESYFLQAEAQLRGIIAGDFEATYMEGLTAAFTYAYTDENESLVLPKDPDTETTLSIADLIASYFEDNADDSEVVNYLVDITEATTFEQRLETIITQKYIALNMVNADEAWNEYRRTGYPVTVTGAGPAFQMASNKSNITSRADRLPTRVMYPSSEQSYNATNYRLIDFTTDMIFWALN
jgi:hypothetical protein